MSQKNNVILITIETLDFKMSQSKANELCNSVSNQEFSSIRDLLEHLCPDNPSVTISHCFTIPAPTLNKSNLIIEALIS